MSRCLLLISWDIGFNPGLTRHRVRDCRLMCANIRVFAATLIGIIGEVTGYDVLLLSETMVL